MSIDDGGCAFPMADIFRPDGSPWQQGGPGMSLLDWFAGQAFSWAASIQERQVVALAKAGVPLPQGDEEFNRAAYEGIASLAYDVAAAMLAEKQKREAAP